MSERTDTPDEKPRRRIAVIASKFHTLHGETHNTGDVYDIDEADLVTLQVQGMAHLREDPKPEPAPEPKPVEPMTTENKPAEG